ncbi:DNA mismatch repair protein Mlh3 isoform X5 [Danio rerio]|uniref:DNA mismatch repair protein Mlh3 isoform X5 n=1 Tax=Danio rerio TaxID=7955 RepID=A0A8N7T846_DANRE|nr:DNA mismatch repair protein Mlh3 isoform X2 [Danio rerio]|eukprot:XP_021325638.1 DNA mismatch repair protein Mlh3 isoform X2 [Danio rerio]
MIKSLPINVQAQLRSGVAIFSLQQCVEELILNSIDAGATCVAVKIDIEACKLQVIDNGSGMCLEDMEKVGLRYNTSKCSSLEDLDNLHFYGFRGEAISSIVSLAEMVEISSRTKQSVKTYVKSFNETNALEVFEAQTVRPSAGTTVSVYNLFHNMPVRRKRMDPVLETERIRQRVEAISLMHPSVSFTVKKENSAHMMVQLSKTSSTYYRFVQIHGLNRAQKLGEVNYEHEQFQITGHIGREGHYNNSLQFLFVNERLLLKTRIHKTLNCLLKRVSGAARQNNSPTSYPVTSSPKQKGGYDLHGIYVINIKCHYSEYDICLEPAKSLIEFKDWDNVLICIEEGVKAFLTKENLVSELNTISNDGLPCSPVRNAESSEKQKRSSEETNEACETMIEKNDSSVVDVADGVQMLEQESIYTESDEGKALQSEDLPFQTTLVGAAEINNNHEEDENAVCSNISHTDSPLAVNKNVMGSKSHKISLPEAQDSLQKFYTPNKTSPKKRRMPLNDTEEEKHVFYGGPSKTFKATPPRKLTLSFETGSLDKFKRLFGKEAEKKQPSTEKTSLLNPNPNDRFVGSTSCLDDLHHPVLRNSSGHPTTHRSTESSSLNKKNKISLAAKCSYLKQDKELCRDSNFLKRDLSSFPPSQDSCFKELEKTLLDEDVLFGSSGIVDSVDFPLIEQDTALPSVAEESHLFNNNVTFFIGNESSVDEASVASQRDPQHSIAGNEEDAQAPDSLSTLFSEWHNPVFIRPPEVAVDVTSGQAEGLAVKIHNILFPYRFTKNMIHTMRVINQVDKKFLACLINTAGQNTSESSTDEGNLLVLVDQHAAHERVRLEGLIADSYEDDPDTPGKKRLCSSRVTPPLEINVTEEELRLLRSCQGFLRGLALDVRFPKSESLSVFLESLPACFIEKESTELRRGRRSVIKTIAEDYLREHIELLRSTGRVRGILPLTVHNVLASQACHGAIKFNDVLNKEECCSLVSSLSSCRLPFQCAHGRPSIVPLADLHHLEEQQDIPKPNLKKLRRMYKSWQLYGQNQYFAQNKA